MHTIFIVNQPPLPQHCGYFLLPTQVLQDPMIEAGLPAQIACGSGCWRTVQCSGNGFERGVLRQFVACPWAARAALPTSGTTLSIPLCDHRQPFQQCKEHETPNIPPWASPFLAIAHTYQGLVLDRVLVLCVPYPTGMP